MDERSLIASIEGAMYRGAEDYFREQEFEHVPTVPHIVGITGACENINTLFDVNYFDKPAYLTQTGQLNLELLVPDLKKVCCMIHSFRAEQENDERHLTEFPLLEFEFAYEGNGMSQLLDHIEQTIKSMFASAATTSAIVEFRPRDEVLQMANGTFPRMSYDDAISILQKKGYEVKFGDDLKHEHEMAIVEETGKPTFVTYYPEKIKFFNMRRDRIDPAVVQSADLLLPYSGESVGSAVREENYELLVDKLVNSPMYAMHLDRGGTLDDFKWYLDAVKERPVPHAGCGIGLSRVTQCVLGRSDIRKSTAYAMNCCTDLNRL